MDSRRTIFRGICVTVSICHGRLCSYWESDTSQSPVTTVRFVESHFMGGMVQHERLDFERALEEYWIWRAQDCG